MDALANRSLAILTLGDFDRGFREYETRWRKRIQGQAARPRHALDGAPMSPARPSCSPVSRGWAMSFSSSATCPRWWLSGAKVLVHCSPDLRGVIETVPGVSGIHHPANTPAIRSLRAAGQSPSDLQDDARDHPGGRSLRPPDPARIKALEGTTRIDERLEGRHRLGRHTVASE